MLKSAHRPAAFAAAATTLAFAMLAAPLSASAAIHTSHFQQQVELVCSSGCVAKFAKLAANEALDIDHVACEVSTTGDVILASIGLLPAETLKFTLPLGLDWQRKALGLNAYTFSAEVNMRVPFGKQAQALVFGSGGPTGHCSITGTKLTNS
jgi:hypothetical protein